MTARHIAALFAMAPGHFGDFMSRVEPDTAGGCWLWTGGTDGNGYGVYSGKRFGLTPDRAHRVAYELFIGPIPDGLVIDHLCRTRACVNPGHLECVTRGENVLRGEGASAQNARKTRCKRGHEFTEANVWRDVRGRRFCRACWRRETTA